jgi:transposase
MTSPADLAHLDAEQLRVLAARLMTEMHAKQALIDKLTHEMATLKRIRFAATSEAYTGEQQRLLFETIETDLEALQAEIDQVTPEAAGQRGRRQPKRASLPANLPRRQIVHEPASTTCRCGCELKRIGCDIAEKLDYQPGVFTVERHVRGKWERWRRLIGQRFESDKWSLADEGLSTAPLAAPCAEQERAARWVTRPAIYAACLSAGRLAK